MGNLKLTSTAFEDGGEIPREYGYKNGNISPPLKILVPAGTSSLALIVDDPDAMGAVGKVWAHWVMYNLKTGTTLFKGNAHNMEIPRGNTIAKPLTIDQWKQAQGNSAMLDANAEYMKYYNQKRFGDWKTNNSGIIGLNDFGEFDYGGPAPPDKRHTYIFKVYALDIDKLPLPRADKPGTKSDVEKAMEGHIIEQTQLTGTYAP
jgi:Raf kinase inhibitor-like YbhB/YbcL family protein